MTYCTPKMSLSGFESSPNDVLYEICSLLYHSDKPSLKSLSFASKRCCDAATLWLFRHLKIDLQSSWSLQQDVNELQCMLKRRNGYGSICHITVSGCLNATGSTEDRLLSTKKRLRDTDWHEQDDINEGNLNRYRLRPSLQPLRDTPELTAPLWQSLVSLLEKIAYLQHFDFNCTNGLPPNVLRVLERCQPACRLHVDNFRWWTLTNDGYTSNDTKLAQSPILYSTYLEYFELDAISVGEDGDNDNAEEAMLRTILNFPPSLKKVHLNLTGDPLRRLHNVNPSGPPGAPPQWEQFIESLNATPPASLDSLTMTAYLRGPIVKAVTRVIDFANLLHLGLLCSVERELMEHLLHKVRFRQLQSLCISLCLPADMVGPQSSVEMSLLLDQYEQWLANLPPLSSLALGGHVTCNIMHAVLTQHGHSLKSLRIYLPQAWPLPTDLLDVEIFRRLRDRCHNLEELTIPLLRSRGKDKEILCYRLLSQCPSLQSLVIKLRCESPHIVIPGAPMPPRNLPGFDDDDMFLYEHDYQPGRVRVGSVRHILIDGALDIDLVRSIWKLIAGSKRGRPLKTLKINTKDAYEFRHAHLRPCLDVMVRSFSLERPIRDDSDEVQIRELGMRSREANLRRIREYEEGSNAEAKATRDHPALMKIFRRIWPERKESSVDWRDDWHSFPLQIDESMEL